MLRSSGSRRCLEANADFPQTMASAFDNVRTQGDMTKIKKDIFFNFDTVKNFTTSWADLFRHAKQILTQTAKQLSLSGKTFSLIETSAWICPEIYQALHKSYKNYQLTKEYISAIVELLKQHKAQIIEYEKSL